MTWFEYIYQLIMHKIRRDIIYYPTVKVLGKTYMANHDGSLQCPYCLLSSGTNRSRDNSLADNNGRFIGHIFTEKMEEHRDDCPQKEYRPRIIRVQHNGKDIINF